MLDLSVHEYKLPPNPTIERIRDITSFRDLTLAENQTIMRMERFITDPDDSINGDIARMVALISGRVGGSGTVVARVQPFRSAPPANTDLLMLLIKKWFEQGKRCGLCMGRLRPNARNPLLQPSPDRIDSRNPSYDDRNLSITHLACNLAKNKFSVEQFEEWMGVLRGEDVDELAGVS